MLYLLLGVITPLSIYRNKKICWKTEKKIIGKKNRGKKIHISTLVSYLLSVSHHKAAQMGKGSSFLQTGG